MTEQPWRKYLLFIALLPMATALLRPQVGVAQGRQPAAESRVKTASKAKKEPGGVARFRERVDAALAGSGGEKAYWGVIVTDADTGQVIYSRNPERYFMPASNAKLFTTAMALATLGPNFRIRTTVESAAELDSSGWLAGDLVLIGRGDANLSSRAFPFLDRAERNVRQHQPWSG